MLRSLIWRILMVQAIAIGTTAFADDPPPLSIEGYTDGLSYLAGETIRLHVSTTVPRYSLEIARLGDKTVSVLAKSDIPGAAHPIPENASSHGCNWPVSYELEVPPEWRPGYYNM